MTAISDDRLLAEVTSSTATVAKLIDGADLTRPVPTCPEWTLRQLATHLGRAHRWAAEIIGTRATEPIGFRQVPDGRLPDDPHQQPGWLTGGAAKIAGAVRASGATPVWTHLGLHPASYWARRMAHETAVHRADAQIAFGQRPAIDTGIAIDGIDEWLGLLQLQPFQPTGDSLPPLASGRVIHLHTTDAPESPSSVGSGAGDAGTGGTGTGGTGTAGEWLISGGPGGLTVSAGHGKGDVAVRGPASDLMLVLVRRLPPDTPGVDVIGDRGLLDAWLAATPF